MARIIRDTDRCDEGEYAVLEFRGQRGRKYYRTCARKNGELYVGTGMWHTLTQACAAADAEREVGL